MSESGQQYVIIIDPSPTVRKILEVCLHRENYENVRTFPDSEAFLRWLKIPDSSIPAIIMLEVNLPFIDGYTLIRTLKSRPAFTDTAFVLLTGRDSMLDRLKARLCGAKVYLTKPFHTQDIVSVIATLLEPTPLLAPLPSTVLYERV